MKSYWGFTIIKSVFEMDDMISREDIKTYIAEYNDFNKKFFEEKLDREYVETGVLKPLKQMYFGEEKTMPALDGIFYTHGLTIFNLLKYKTYKRTKGALKANLTKKENQINLIKKAYSKSLFKKGYEQDARYIKKMQQYNRSMEKLIKFMINPIDYFVTKLTEFEKTSICLVPIVKMSEWR